MNHLFIKAGWMISLVLSALLALIMAFPYAPHEYDVLGDYVDYMPGQPVRPLLQRNCELMNDYYEYASYNGFYCRFFGDTLVYVASGSLDKDGTHIDSIYFSLRRCLMITADLVLSTDGKIGFMFERRHTPMSIRKISFVLSNHIEGQSYSYARGTHMWTPQACLYGIYLFTRKGEE